MQVMEMHMKHFGKNLKTLGGSNTCNKPQGRESDLQSVMEGGRTPTAIYVLVKEFN